MQEVNTLIDLAGIHPKSVQKPPPPEQQAEYNADMAAWTKSKNEGPQPEMVIETYTPSEIFGNYVDAAIANAYPHAEKIVLFRCAKITRAFAEASAGNGVANLDKKDLAFVNKCFNKCKWANNAQNQVLIKQIDGKLSEALNVGGK